MITVRCHVVYVYSISVHYNISPDMYMADEMHLVWLEDNPVYLRNGSEDTAQYIIVNTEHFEGNMTYIDGGFMFKNVFCLYRNQTIFTA